MADRERPYLFYDVAISICSRCFRKVEGKLVIQDEKVFMLKRCPEHGFERVLIADDAAYYRRCRESFIKKPEQPNRYNTEIRWGCPYDCGLCPDHEQHSCVSLVEVTDACNLRCPVCYAESGPERVKHRSLEHIERMLDAIIANERHPDVVQISGGEPTVHPQFFEILAAAKKRPIRHLMVNTNGIRIATEAGFAERLAEFKPHLEVYLQFDTFERAASMDLRGADLREIRQAAIDKCNALDLAVTLVSTVKAGVNDHELGKTIEWALQQPCVRGVTFQPVQHAGRADGFDPARDRLTLTEVRRKILEQTQVFKPDDLIPVPCHPDSLAMAYALKVEGNVVPLSGMVPLETWVAGARNTILLEQDPATQKAVFSLFSTANGPEAQADRLCDLLCCLPRIQAPEKLGYANVFRVLIVQFIDAHSFDVRSVKKSCIHIVHPDGRLIPFDTYNLFYRDELERTRLAPLRERALAG